MATTTIVNGNVYVTTGTVSGTTITHTTNEVVEIFSARIEYNYLNDIGGYGHKSRGEPEKDKPRTIRDMKKIQKVITVTGILDDESALRAITKRNNLLFMGEFKGRLTLVWGIGNYRTLFSPFESDDPILAPSDIKNHEVFILKIRFRESAGIYGTVFASDPSPFTKYDIEIQFITGKET